MLVLVTVLTYSYSNQCDGLYMLVIGNYFNPLIVIIAQHNYIDQNYVSQPEIFQTMRMVISNFKINYVQLFMC